MTEPAIIRLFSNMFEEMRQDIKKDLQEFIENAIEAHRRRMWVRDTWCCKEMVKFASIVWLSPNPPKCDEQQSLGSVSLQLRGINVNYCPFCGVRVGKP